MIDCKTASVSEIQKALWVWQHRNFPQYFDGTRNDLYEHLKYGVIEEMGEFFHATLKRKQGIRGTAAEHDAAIRDAVGDMLIYSAQLASCRGKNLELNAGGYTNRTLIEHCAHLCVALDDGEIESVVNQIEYMALIAGVNSEMCFREAAEQVLSRDWIKYPKTGKPEAGEGKE